VLRNPATLDWQPIVKVEHYRLRVESIRQPVELHEERASYQIDSDMLHINKNNPS
jgi:hypothetical protein